MPLNAATQAATLSVAPMMDWTDRHCRALHRLISRHALLYTEMVTAPALVRGVARHLLRFDPGEHPVALQLGGSDPVELARAAQIGAEEGYDEINLNVGCPSDRVQSGCFGAVLMKTHALVGECVAAMIAATRVEITVKCRIGVDDQEPHEVLPAFLETVREAGVRRVAIHARKAWLKGLSAKENRDIPPLDYPIVLEMKRAFSDLHISINGGIQSIEEAQSFLAQGIDGVMIGRAAYQAPMAILGSADRDIFGDAKSPVTSPREIVEAMVPHIEAHLAEGGRLHAVTRHMLGLFAGQPGARAWRRALSEAGAREGAGVADLLNALDHVPQAAAA
ncbi:MAG: tRNA dihydrouridine(20/20a) synthase DusA [Pseudomonadota bacterium]